MEDNMKIDDKDIASSSLQNISKTGAGNTSRRPAATSSDTTASSNDQVSLSNTQILSAASTAGEAGRASRVAELRQLYVSGNYNVDAQDLSRSIIDAHLSGA